MQYKADKIEECIQNLIKELGLNLNDPNFKETPRRISQSLYEFLKGIYEEHKIEGLFSKTFPAECDELILVKNNQAISLCPHHLLPVRYKIHIGYIPNKGGRVIGLSKIPRIVQLLAARPILQEQLAPDIANAFEKHLNPLGVMVIIIGEHDCMQCRGIKEPDSIAITSIIRGIFRENEGQIKEEFLALLNQK